MMGAWKVGGRLKRPFSTSLLIDPFERVRMSQKLVPLAGCWALMVLWPPAPSLAEGRKVSEAQIQVAINEAVAHLRQQVANQDGGEGALITMALLKSGLPPDTPEIKKGLEKIKSRIVKDEYKPGTHHVYEAGVSLMALANADAKAYKPQIEAIARYLIGVQRPTGEWDYPSPGTGDTSITQYAILGLWEAVRSGVTVPRRVWDKVAGWHVTRQLSDGGFTYHPFVTQDVGAAVGGGTASHTMTVAGTASLLVCRMHLYAGAADVEEVQKGKKKRGKKFGVLIPVDASAEEPAPPETVLVDDANFRATTRLAAIDKAVGKGKKWLNEHFTIEPKANWDLYYLYGLERLAALAGVKEFDGHDWYDEGAAQLVRTQSGGTWQDGCGINPATAFGILFLGKATQKMIAHKAARPEPKFGGGILVGGRGLPENLGTLQVEQGSVRVRKLKGPVDELLAELENAESRQVESAQAALVESIATDNPEGLIGQADRLLKLARDKRVEVRRTVFWALGRSNELSVVPTLINGLSDPDPGCMIEARNALRYISKRIDVHEPPDEATPGQKASAIAYWKKWYQGVRPYDDRDDLGEATK
jgi:hypothetical protein